MTKKYSIFLFSFFLLVGCGGGTDVDQLLQGRKIDYKQSDAQESAALQYPPDLISSSVGSQQTVSLSEYTIGSIPNVETDLVVDEIEEVKVYYRRDGRLRWVEVDLDPNLAWHSVRQFWVDYLGFGLEKENPELGLMETDWLSLRDAITTPGLLGGYLDDFFNRLHDSGERDKFVIRLERTSEGRTEIYVSHRHITAQFTKEGLFSSYKRLAGDPQLEIEMLRRLMLYMAAREQEDDNADIEAQITGVETDNIVSDYELNGPELWINKKFLESWQLVQIGLDRGGFTIVDRDLQLHVIYIRHSGGPESEEIFGKAETGFFNKLFDSGNPVLRDIELVLEEEDGRTRVSAMAPAEDKVLTELQSSVILELLHEYLP